MLLLCHLSFPEMRPTMVSMALITCAFTRRARFSTCAWARDPMACRIFWVTVSLSMNLVKAFIIRSHRGRLGTLPGWMDGEIGDGSKGGFKGGLEIVVVMYMLKDAMICNTDCVSSVYVALTAATSGSNNYYVTQQKSITNKS